MSYYFPFILVLTANTFYHICAKSVPESADTWISLVESYLTAAILCAGIYLMTKKGSNLSAEIGQLNWTSIVLGVAVVGLEAGYLLMYRAGWPIHTAQISQGSLLAIVLLLVGYLLFHESITLKQIAGVLVCLGGLYLINS